MLSQGEMGMKKTIPIQYTNECSFALNRTLEHNSLCYHMEIPKMKESKGVRMNSGSRSTSLL